LWHHVAFVVDAAGGRLYVDGLLRASRAWSGTPGATTTTQRLALGAYPGTATPYLRGRLDDVRIYSRALSASELASLSATPDTAAPSISAVASSGVTTTAATITWTTNEPADSQVEYGTTTAYGSQSTRDATLATGHTQTLAGLIAGTLYHYRVRSRDAAGNQATSQDFSLTTTSPAPPGDGKQRRPVGRWKFSEGVGSAALDASGLGHTGTLMNGAARTAGTAGPGLGLDGIDDYVDVPHAADLDAYPLTISVWVKSGATGSGGLVNKYAPASFNGYQLFFENGNLCAWYFRDASSHVWDGTGCTLATQGVADDLWHHVAFVVDATGGRLYVDGLLKTSRAWTGTPGATTTLQRLAFGAYPGTAAPYLRGQIDDVRIHPRVLTPEEIFDAWDAAAPNP
ncbi:MAG: LamG-like jellyroll fold domain-containing protein, partial [Candidatus Polarisedimenticolia bacterium]